jgi:hypothetical protein
VKCRVFTIYCAGQMTAEETSACTSHRGKTPMPRNCLNADFCDEYDDCDCISSRPSLQSDESQFKNRGAQKMRRKAPYFRSVLSAERISASTSQGEGVKRQFAFRPHPEPHVNPENLVLLALCNAECSGKTLQLLSALCAFAVKKNLPLRTLRACWGFHQLATCGKFRFILR